MRKNGYWAKGVHLGLSFREKGYWHEGKLYPRDIFDSRDIYNLARLIRSRCPYEKPVHTISISVFGLTKDNYLQMELWKDTLKTEKLIKSLDEVNRSQGDFTIYPAGLLKLKHEIHDRISFGH